MSESSNNSKLFIPLSADTEKFQKAIEMEELRNENLAMKKLLKEIQHSSTSSVEDYSSICPVCNSLEPKHKKDCKLAGFIEE